jgi:hypothetical protein
MNQGSPVDTPPLLEGSDPFSVLKWRGARLPLSLCVDLAVDHELTGATTENGGRRRLSSSLITEAPWPWVGYTSIPWSAPIRVFDLDA